MRPRKVCLLLELGLPARHAVEGRARELARGTLDVAQVARQRPELVVGARVLTLADGELRQPLAVEQPGLHRRIRLRLGVAARHEQSARGLEVGIHRLAGDQQVHDLARAFEDAVHAHVAHHLLHGHGLLASRLERLRGLVAATAPDLHQLVDHLPRELRAVHLAQGGFDPDVVALVVGQPRRRRRASPRDRTRCRR